MTNATADEIAELLGDRADETIVERIANIGATLTEVSEALDDVEYQTRYGDPRDASSAKVDEIRAVLEELPYFEDLLDTEGDAENGEGLTVVGPDDHEISNERF